MDERGQSKQGEFSKMSDEVVERTVIPAASGWYVATPMEGGVDEKTGEKWDASFKLDQVIAWEIERTEGTYRSMAGAPREKWVTRRAIPICFEGLLSRWALKTPDGEFIVEEDAWFQDEQRCLKYLMEKTSTHED